MRIVRYGQQIKLSENNPSQAIQMATSTCPDDNTLVQMLCGSLPAALAEAHEPHLAHCEQCAERAAQMHLDDDLVDALRGTGTVDETTSIADGPIVDDLIERINGFAERPNLAPLPTDDELRGILGPETDGEELGWLGQYRILEVLGAGGMGIVFRAEDTQLGRPVAVKVMRPQLATSRDACRRFQREVCAASAFEHNNVVTIYNVGEERGTPYFSMQLLEGESLRRRLSREGHLSTHDVLRIGREIAMGLDAAHQRGLLHRDIKPDNIWLEADADQVKIVDFGLARDIDQSSTVTHSGAIRGTPRYMAPEQVRCESIDARCDLFSLGSLLFHMATGEAAFTGNNLVATLVAVSQDEVTPPCQLNPDVPRELSDLILRLLEKDPAARIQTAEEVIRRIERIEANQHKTASPAPFSNRRRVTSWLVATAALFCIALATLIYVVTDKGTLVVEADESVAVAVENGKVMIRDRESGREWIARIGRNPVKSGAYEIFTKEKGSDLEFSMRELNIMRGEERKVHISIKRESAPVRNKDGADFVDSGAKPRATPEWLSETEDSLGIKPGDPMSSSALVTTPSRLNKAVSWTVETVEHRAYVNDAVFSSDGAWIATAGQDGTTRIWRASDRQLQTIIVCPGPVETVAWTGDGRYLATAQSGDGTGSICIWDLVDGGARLVKKINRKTRHLAWSPDGGLLAFRDNEIIFWEFASGEILPSRGVTGGMSHRPWSADGKLLATTNDKGIAVWSVADQKQVMSLSNRGAREAIWSRQGSYLSCIRLSLPPIGTEPSRRVRSVPGHVEIWDVTKNQRVRNFAIGQGTSGHLSWSPDEATIVTDFNNVISLWDVKTGKLRSEIIRRDRDYRIGRNEVDWSAKSKQIAVLFGGTVRLWDVDEKKIERLTGRSDLVRLESSSFDASKGMLATTFNYESTGSTLWDLDRLTALVKFDEAGWTLHPSPDGKRLAAIHTEQGVPWSSPVDVEIRYFSLPSGKETGSIKTRVSRVPFARWSPDSRRLLVCARDVPHALILDESRVLHEVGQFYKGGVSLHRSNRDASRVAWSPDSKYLAWSDSRGGIDIIDAATGEVACKLAVSEKRDLNAQFHGLAWDPSGKRVARVQAGRDAPPKVHFWDVKPSPKQLLPTSSLTAAESDDVVFSPDGKWIASAAGSDVVTVWNVESGERVAAVRCPSEWIHSIAWLPDNRAIAVSAADGFGVVDVESQTVEFHAKDVEGEPLTSSQSGDAFAVGWWNHVSFYGLDTKLRTTLVLPLRPRSGALTIQPNGAFRVSDGGAEPRMVVLSDDVQRTLTPADFQREFNWRNEPADREFGSTSASAVEDRLGIQPGQPFSELALVSRPAVLPDVESWTLETVDQRSEVVNVEFSPDGTRVATSGLDGVVRIWDPSTRRLQDMIICPGVVWSFSWSPDGKKLATAQMHDIDSTSGTVCLWEVEGGVRLLRKINRPALQIHWSSDGKVLAGTREKRIWFWMEDSQTLHPGFRVDGYTSKRPFSPDGKLLAVTIPNGIQVWDVANASLKTTLPTDKCANAVWLSDGENIACARVGLFSESGENVYLHKVEVWNVAKAERVEETTVASHTTTMQVDFEFSDDEKTLLTNIRGKIQLWNRSQGKPLGDPIVESADTYIPGYTPSARLAAGGRYLAYVQRGVAKLWDFETKSTNRLTGYSTGVSITGASIGEKAQFLVTKTHDESRHTVWDLGAPNALFHLTGDTWRTEISPDGSQLAALRRVSSGETTPMEFELRIYRLHDAALHHTIKLEAALPPQIVWAPDNTHLALTNSSSAHVPLADPTKKKRGVALIKASFTTIVDAREGKVLLERGNVLDTRYQPRQSVSHRNSKNEAQRAAWSPDSRFLAAWDQGSTVIVMDIATGEILHRLNAPHRSAGSRAPGARRPNSVFGIAWSPSGERLAYLDGEDFGSRRLVVWNMSEENPELVSSKYLGNSRGPRRKEHVIFSPDGRRIVVGLNTMKLTELDATSAESKVTLDGNGIFWWAAWQSDSQRIVFLGPYGVELWNPETGERSRPLGPRNNVSSAVLLAGDSCATSAGPRVIFWDEQLRRTSSWLIDLATPGNLVGVAADGNYVQSEDASPPRFVVQAKGEQSVLEYKQFSQQYGWENKNVNPTTQRAED